MANLQSLLFLFLALSFFTSASVEAAPILPIHKPVSNRKTFVECATAPSDPQDRRKKKNRLVITTWNVNFLFEKELGTGCPGPKCKWKTFAMAQQHILNVAHAAANAPESDIFVLEETQDCDILKSVAEKIRMTNGDDTYKPYLIKGTDTGTGQNIGILSRVDPMEDLKRIESSRNRVEIAKNAVFRFKLDNHDTPFTLIGVHLLAFPGVPERDSKRTIQAQLLQTYITKQVPKSDRLIVVGDFNDFSVQCPHPAPTTPTSQVFNILEQQTKFNDQLLQNVACKAPQSERVTTVFQPNGKSGKVRYYEALDHILVDAQTLTKVHAVTFGSKVFSEDEVYFSDHFPVSVHLRLKAPPLTKAQKKRLKRAKQAAEE